MIMSCERKREREYEERKREKMDDLLGLIDIRRQKREREEGEKHKGR